MKSYKSLMFQQRANPKTNIDYKCSHAQLGWIVLPPIKITAWIRGAMHTTTAKLLQDQQTPNSKTQSSQ